MPKKNYGFKPGRIKRFGKKRNWHHGDGKMSSSLMLGAPDLFPNGHGQGDYLLDFEPQNKPGYFDSMSCFVYGTEKALGMYIKRVYPESLNTFSKRFHFILSGGTLQGGSPHDACESIRIHGNIRNELLNISTCNSWHDWNSPNPMTVNFLNEGKTRTKYWDFYHDWLFTPGIGVVKMKLKGDTRQGLIKEALKNYGVAVSVDAWHYDNKGYAIKSPGATDNHWIELFEYEDNFCFPCYDDYASKEIVRCRWDYPFGYAKRVRIVRKDDVIANDAKYIIKTMIAKNIKGDLNNTVYFIFNGEKLAYPSMDVFNQIQDKYNGGNKTIITVAQEPLDAIPIGSPRSVVDIENAQIYFTPAKP